MLPHLRSGWAVDQAILNEEDRVVVLRYGHDWDPTCMQMDEVLYGIAELVKNYAVIYLVDTTEVPDFNTMYELYDPCTVMFFYRNKVRTRSRRRAALPTLRRPLPPFPPAARPPVPPAPSSTPPSTPELPPPACSTS